MRLKNLLLTSAVLLSMASAFAQIVDGGTTGPLTWQVTGAANNYTLTISGEGAMPDYAYNSPWEQYKPDIKTILIGEGVTTIGDCAFNSCDKLTSITLSNNLTNIGDAAFYNCKALTSITIPNNVTSMGNHVFMECGKLTSVTLSTTYKYDNFGKLKQINHPAGTVTKDTL